MFGDDDDLNLDDGPHSSRSTVFIRPDAPYRPVRTMAKKRKFPGPAGLLHSGFNDRNEETNNKSDDDFVVLSQDPSHHFIGIAWKTMLQELGPHRRVLDEYNIRYIQDNAYKRRMEKIPILIAVLIKIEVSLRKITTANCILRDPTGEIESIVDHKVYEESAEEFVPGAVVVLRDVAILTLGSSRKHYLIVTPKNLLTIYYEHTKITENNPNLGLRITRGGNLDFADILKRANDRNSNITEDRECRNLQDYRNLQNVSSRNSRDNSRGSESRVQSSRGNLNLGGRTNHEFLQPSCLKANKSAKSNIFESDVLEDLDEVFSDDFNVDFINFGKSKFPSQFEAQNTTDDLQFTPKCSDRFTLDNERFTPEDPTVQMRQRHFLQGSQQFPLQNQAGQHESAHRFSEGNLHRREDTNRIPASQISFTETNSEHSQILKEVFEGVPVDSFDDDF